MRGLSVALFAGLAACGPARVQTAAPAEAGPAIVQTGAPVLRTRAEEVAPERIPTPEIQGLIDRMITAMRLAPGVGLAAPQLGVPLRIFVFEDTPERMARLTPAEVQERERVVLPVQVIINPVLRPVGDEKRTFFEGCLSIAGYAALVERHLEVEVSGLDRQGKPVTLRVLGWPARILQHETDHLDGALYVDRMVTRSFSTGEQVKERFAGRPIAEILGAFGLAP